MAVRRDQGFEPASQIVQAGQSRTMMANLDKRFREMDDEERSLLQPERRRALKATKWR